MTDKKRLEEIKENVTVDIVDLVYYVNLDGLIEHWVKSYTLSEGDYRYLIKQAERVEKLEKENEKLRKLEKYDSLEINNLSQQNKRYRKIIENVELVAQNKGYDDIYNFLVEELEDEE